MVTMRGLTYDVGINCDRCTGLLAATAGDGDDDIRCPCSTAQCADRYKQNVARLAQIASSACDCIAQPVHTQFIRSINQQQCPRERVLSSAASGMHNLRKTFPTRSASARPTTNFPRSL